MSHVIDSDHNINQEYDVPVIDHTTEQVTAGAGWC